MEGRISVGMPSLLRLLLSSFQFTPAIQSRSTAAVTQPVLVKQSSCCRVLLPLSSEARVQQKVFGKLYHPILIGVWYIIYPIHPCLFPLFPPLHPLPFFPFRRFLFSLQANLRILTLKFSASKFPTSKLPSSDFPTLAAVLLGPAPR